MMTLAVDFDMTLHDSAHPLPGRKMGPPLPGAVDSMEYLHQRGHKLIIFSVNNKKVIRDWCEYYDVYYDSITDIKFNADYFIDDKAIHFNSWDQVMNELGEGDDDE